jgi:hypothetical protein
MTALDTRLHVCPNCGSTNVGTQTLCARCSANLQSAPRRGAKRGHLRRALTIVTTVASLVGGGISLWHATHQGRDPAVTPAAAAPLSTLTSTTAAATVTVPAPAPAPAPTTAAPAAPPADTSLQPDDATATSTLAPETSAGGTGSYEPALATDGREDTAWCTPGDGTGQTLMLRFAQPVLVTAVGIVPGYDKVDPTTGADRFFENRVIVTVRYTFSDGTVIDDAFGDPIRAMKRTQLPTPLRTTSVAITPTAVSDSGADTCISETLVFGHHA